MPFGHAMIDFQAFRFSSMIFSLFAADSFFAAFSPFRALMLTFDFLFFRRFTLPPPDISPSVFRYVDTP